MLCRVLHLGCIDAQLDHRSMLTNPSSVEKASWQRSHKRHALPTPAQHKYFFAINLYNSFDIIPDLFSVIFRVSAILGLHNVVISVYENGSSDQTQALLRLVETLGRSVGLRVVIRTSLRTRGQLHHHHEYLAEVRNAALAPLYELREATGEVFDSIVFMVGFPRSCRREASPSEVPDGIPLASIDLTPERRPALCGRSP